MPESRDETAQRLLEVNMLVMRSLSAEMRRDHQGLTPMHVGLLTRIDAGETNLSDLAAHLSVRLPTISKSIKLLVERGWVERWVPEDNRRLTMVRLTAEGRRELGAMKKRAVNHVAGLLGSLTRTERRSVDSALTLLCDVLTKHPCARDKNEVKT
jgi:DNA-binding MarR family transcriptional regulator